MWSQSVVTLKIRSKYKHNNVVRKRRINTKARHQFSTHDWEIRIQSISIFNHPREFSLIDFIPLLHEIIIFPPTNLCYSLKFIFGLILLFLIFIHFFPHPSGTGPSKSNSKNHSLLLLALHWQHHLTLKFRNRSNELHSKEILERFFSSFFAWKREEGNNEAFLDGFFSIILPEQRWEHSRYGKYEKGSWAPQVFSPKFFSYRVVEKTRSFRCTPSFFLNILCFVKIWKVTKN